MSLYGSPSQPDYAAAVSTIQGMDNDTLQELLSDENKLEAMLRSLTQVKALYDEKEMLMASNKSLAEYNLSQEPVLTEARTRLADKHREAIKTVERVKNLKKELDDKAGNVDPDTLLALLQAAHAQAEEASDVIAEDYLQKRIEGVDEFLETFLEKRKVAHLRRIKVDKMKELLAQPQSGPSTPSRRAPAPPGPAIYNLPAVPAANNWAVHDWGAPAQRTSYPPANAGAAPYLPYPLNPIGMPTPGGGY